MTYQSLQETPWNEKHVITPQSSRKSECCCPHKLADQAGWQHAYGKCYGQNAAKDASSTGHYGALMNSNNWWKTGRRLSRLQWLCSASLVLLLLPTASFSGLGASPSFRPFHSGQSASGLDLSQSPSNLPNLPALNPATFHCYTGCNSTNYCCLLSMMIHGSFTHSKSRHFSGGILVPKKVDRKTIFEEKPF